MVKADKLNRASANPLASNGTRRLKPVMARKNSAISQRFLVCYGKLPTENDNHDANRNLVRMATTLKYAGGQTHGERKMQKWTILAGAAALALSLDVTAAQAAASKPHSAVSIECSKEADAKGLHGKARKHFRAECKRAGKPGATTGKSS